MNTTRAKELLRRFQLEELFVDELGWDRHASALPLTVDGIEFALEAVAHKRGMVAYSCPIPDGQVVPYAVRCKLETQVAKNVREHIVVFTDEAKGLQIWQWVKRETGKPVARREHVFQAPQTGESLIQKLSELEVTLDEEEEVDLLGMTTRVRKAFDLDRVTKKFYDIFKKQHAAFLKAIVGISEKDDREWYASIMLNRLMFTYFIQAKGFLDEDKQYLRNRLRMVQERRGKGKFLSFYRCFLLKLFHDGLGKKERDADTRALLGRIPYLNGGVFEVHQLEDQYSDIDIPDAAFEKVFDFFDQYEWHLDNRPTRDDREINPDVLGYIFEKYINQKQMGAYYTKEDITEYISKNTIVPFIFDKARRELEKKKMGDAYAACFALLAADPDRYIYAAVRHGTELDLPTEIAKGIDTTKSKLLERRAGWNSRAPEEYALPTEIWREVVARRQRYEDVRGKLARGEVREINELITLNLNIRQFAQDAIENCADPHLLNALWKAISEITVLDPTCGSGAFLFAALNILEPLYEVCLDRMRAFMLEWSEAPKCPHPNYYKEFAAVIARIDEHANERYFIYKSVVINNLYGVDIMEEAVEICKLRLFLKLAAQVEPDYGKDNIGIEPLPDIDFNIRAGNTLVGFATENEARLAMTEERTGSVAQVKMLYEEDSQAFARFEEQARLVAGAFREFRDQQTTFGGGVTAEDKRELRQRLEQLSNELDGYLAQQYEVSQGGKGSLSRWKGSHHPFHWCVEFYAIVSSGGFEVIIGNPPWKEYSAVKKAYHVRGYQTEGSGNLYALCAERSLALLAPRGLLSFIVQLPLASSSRMQTMRQFLRDRAMFLAAVTCDDRPGKLFDGLQHCRSTVFVAQRGNNGGKSELWTSGYRRWASEVREDLFDSTAFCPSSDGPIEQGQFPKLASLLQVSAFRRLFAPENRPVELRTCSRPTPDYVFYQESAQYWVKATVGLPYYAKDGCVGAPAHGRYFYFEDKASARTTCAILNSSLFYVYYITYGDCFHVSNALAGGLPVPRTVWEDRALADLGTELMCDLTANAQRKTINTRDGSEITYAEFRVNESKPIIDKIDMLLAAHYGFTEDELDYIINYDIKYRMGDALGDDDSSEGEE